jgi:hypothetical protein
MEVTSQLHARKALPPEKELHYPLDRRLDEARTIREKSFAATRN